MDKFLLKSQLNPINQNHNEQKIGFLIDLTVGAEADPSESDFNDSDDDDELAEALAESESAGQEAASMTGLASIAPLRGTLHAGLLPRESAAAVTAVATAEVSSIERLAVADAMEGEKLGFGSGIRVFGAGC